MKNFVNINITLFCLLYCGSAFSNDPTHTTTSTWNGKYGKEGFAIHTTDPALAENRARADFNTPGINATHVAKAGADNGLNGKGMTSHESNTPSGNADHR